MTLWIWIRNQWDRAVGLLAVLGGVVALAAGWVGASGTVYPAQQIPFLMSGGLFGIFLLGIGCTAWLSADLRDEWTKLDRIESALNRLADTSLVDADACQPASQASTRANANLVESAS